MAVAHNKLLVRRYIENSDNVVHRLCAAAHYPSSPADPYKAIPQ